MSAGPLAIGQHASLRLPLIDFLILIDDCGINVCTLPLVIANTGG